MFIAEQIELDICDAWMAEILPDWAAADDGTLYLQFVSV